MDFKEKQKKYVSDIMRGLSYDVITPKLDPIFSKKDKPSKPIISIHTREQRDTAKIIKTFSIPIHLRFYYITFKQREYLFMFSYPLTTIMRTAHHTS